MKKRYSLKKITQAFLLLAGTGSVYALPPDATPSITLFISGGGAQDPALEGLLSKLALAGTFDVYKDNQNPASPGARFSAYFFQTNNSKIPGISSGATPVNLLIYKRTYGSAGYGVVPLLSDDYQVQQLDIKAAGAVSPITSPDTFYRVSVSNLQNTRSDAGLTGVDIGLFTGINYPTAIGTDPAFPILDVSKASDKLVINAAGGLVYGVGVTLDLYKALQAAQIATGTLPADTKIGDYSKESSIPNLGRNFAASLIAGKIRTWDDVQVIDERPIATGANTGQKLGTLTSFATQAGVSAPSVNGKNLVAVANRNKGAAVGAAINAVLLNAPGTQNAFNPVTSPGNPTNGPIAAQLPGTSQVTSLLADWQAGGNTSTYNADSAKHWGVGIQSLDYNASGAIGKDPSAAYRYVRIDGAAPTLPNVANGTYPLWAESTFQWRNAANNGPSGDKLVILQKLAADLASPSVAASINQKIVQTFGPSGAFAVSTDPSITENAPFDASNPVVSYTHVNGGLLSGSIVPTFNSAKTGPVTLK